MRHFSSHLRIFPVGLNQLPQNPLIFTMFLLLSSWMIAQTNYQLSFVAKINFPSSPAGCSTTDTTGGSDVWGYSAPDGSEYAIMGVKDGVAFVKVPDMQIIDVVPGPQSGDCWYHRDIKTYSHYAYIVAEMTGANQGLMIVDLQYLPDSVRFVGSYVHGSDVRSHNFSIDVNTGYAYICKQNYSGFRVVSLADPEQPVDVITVNTGNIHDVYARNDTVVASEGWNGSFSIWDLSNKNNPVMLTRINVPNAGYAHNAWLSDDGRYLMTTEETDSHTVKIWDIQDMSNVSLLGEYLASNYLAHNTHIMGNLAVISHYSSGVVVVDISDPSQPIEVANYDTYPADDLPGFWGCWGAYPFTDGGYVYASNFNGDLYVLKLEEAPTSVDSRQQLPNGFSLEQNYPNPFNPTTRIPFEISHSGIVRLKVHDLTGKEVATLVDKRLAPGAHSAEWNAGNFASGVYYYKFSFVGDNQGQRFEQVRKMILLR